MMRLLKNRITSSFLGIFIVTVLAFAPFSPTFQHQIVEAKPGDATEPTQIANNVELGILNGTAIGNAVSNGISAFATNVLMVKEISLDAIAWGIINIILQEMIRSITEWVNAGFPDGGPAFVQDFGGFLRNIADGLVGDFILGTPLGFMCSPFHLDIQLALSAQYLFGREIGETGYQPQCRLTDIMANIQNFAVNVDGDVDLDVAQNPSNFAAGGWAWWLGSTAEQENNVYGAYAAAQAGLAITLRNAKGEEKEILKWNKGFLNLTKCDPPGSKTNCKTVTPGTVIEAQLNKALGGGQDRLTIADEINELIAALLAQLAQKVMGGIAGLFGSTQPFAGSTPTFFDDLATAVASTSSVAGATAIAEAERYIAEHQRVIDRRQDMVDTRAAVNASTTVTATAPPLPTVVQDAMTTSAFEIATTTRQIEAMEDFQDDFETETDTQARLDILDDVSALQNAMPTSQDTAEIKTFLDTRNNAFNTAIVDWYDDYATLIAAGGGKPSDFLPVAYLPSRYAP